ncbi:MAG: acetoacetate decarboxylase family protein [Leptolyngbya sp. SIO4C5]|nr:acetoacetate decarboxylase family protein [Leptolyngbya sp. SIO4C5]
MVGEFSQTYPPAPWQLIGTAIQTLQPVSLARSRSFIPDQFDIVPIWPGKTLGGLYFAQYVTGSTLTYQELIVISGLVRYAGKLGFWISHIYVDNLASVAGGRQIWGLPKEVATFTWRGEPLQVGAEQSAIALCELTAQVASPRLPLQLPVAAFGQQLKQRLWFTAIARFQLQWLSAVQIQVPAASPFASLQLDSPWLTFRLKSLQLEVNPPQRLD